MNSKLLNKNKYIKPISWPYLLWPAIDLLELKNVWFMLFFQPLQIPWDIQTHRIACYEPSNTPYSVLLYTYHDKESLRFYVPSLHTATAKSRIEHYCTLRQKNTHDITKPAPIFFQHPQLQPPI